MRTDLHLVPPDSDASGAFPSLIRNGILARVPTGELRLVAEQGEEYAATLREVFFEEGDPLEHVYFPLTGMASMVTMLDDGGTVEAMAIGREGFVGLTILHEVELSGYKGLCQIEGRFFRLSSKAFRSIVDTTPELRRRLLRYSEFSQRTIAQWAACNSVHLIEQRCARWIMVTADSIGTSSFSLTQEFLSQMLSVRRPGVTVAIGGLQRRGLISHHYGKVTIIDEPGLRKAACECYQKVRERAAALLV
ncbi:MAG TPA: Crp/Fnr family transcriptional regulator [Gemmatimonadaceae bacterium]|nr:Crp/Fnr family transcriptional regulator [Gemmatimonadaceae bacterium]